MNADTSQTKPVFLMPPPRYVPKSLHLQVLFGGFYNQFGWAMFGFGMIFFWLFALKSDVTSWFLFSGKLATAPAIVSENFATHYSQGGRSGSRGTPIYGNSYSFTASDGRVHYGTSYVTGRGHDVGDRVMVEYRPGNPDLSRIVGMRRSIIGPFGIFAAIFPALGVIFIRIGLRDGRRGVRLLEMGRITTGRLINKQETNTTINKRRVYSLTFSFVGNTGGKHEVVAKTHLPEYLEDDAEERLLYDPYNPSYAVMLDSLPGAPEIDQMGNFRPTRLIKASFITLIPAATIVGHGSYLVYRFFQG